MATTTMTTGAADAAEEAFLRGEWVAALALSKESLTRRVLQVRSCLFTSSKRATAADDELSACAL